MKKCMEMYNSENVGDRTRRCMKMYKGRDARDGTEEICGCTEVKIQEIEQEGGFVKRVAQSH